MGVDIDLVIQGYKLTCAAPSWADAASVAATRALRLVVSVRSVTPRGMPVLAALVGGGEFGAFNVNLEPSNAVVAT